MSATTLEPRAGTRVDYLNADYGWKSWLFTTDHKRIALLYLISITLYFFVGGAFAVLMRIHLIDPQGALVQPETYNKLFTMHGIIMIFFFLIPSIPAVFGNFLVPMMIGARDLAFPRLNLLSWYVYMVGGMFTMYSVIHGGVDTGWTFYTPYSSTYANSQVIPVALGVFITGFSSILTGLNFIVTILASSWCWARRYLRSRFSCSPWNAFSRSAFLRRRSVETRYYSKIYSGSIPILPFTS